MNPNKTDFACFKQERVFPTLSDKLLKFVDQLKYIGSIISSTESDVNLHLAKV